MTVSLMLTKSILNLNETCAAVNLVLKTTVNQYTIYKYIYFRLKKKEREHIKIEDNFILANVLTS